MKCWMLKTWVWVITMWLLIKAATKGASPLMTQVIFIKKSPGALGLIIQDNCTLNTCKLTPCCPFWQHNRCAKWLVKEVSKGPDLMIQEVLSSPTFLCFYLVLNFSHFSPFGRSAPKVRLFFPLTMLLWFLVGFCFFKAEVYLLLIM